MLLPWRFKFYILFVTSGGGFFVIIMVMVFDKHSITHIVASIRHKNTDQRIVIIDTARPFMRGTPKVVTTWQPTTSGTSKFNEIIDKTVLNTTDDTVASSLDVALAEYTDTEGVPHGRHPAMTVIPFDEQTTMSGTIWHHGTVYNLFVKGAPEQVLSRCDLTENEREQAIMMFHKFTTRGHSVVAIASTELSKPVSKFDELPKKVRLSFNGFVVLDDMFSAKAKQAASQAITNGITIIMLTGEHAETAYHAAHKLGIISSRNQVFDSHRLHTMSDDEIVHRMKTVRVFARTSAADKKRIVSLLDSKTAS